MIEQYSDFNVFKKEAFKDSEVRDEYNRLKLEFDLADQLIIARKKANLSQKDLAILLHTKQPAIARFEHGGYTKSSLERLEAYVEALGFELDIRLSPKNNPGNTEHPLL